MRLLKNYWKSFLFGAFGAFVLLCIGTFACEILTPNTAPEAPDTDTRHKTAETVKQPIARDIIQGGHRHDNEWHRGSLVPPPKIKRVRVKTNIPALKNIGPALPVHDDVILPPPPLPADIQNRLGKLHREMVDAGTKYEIQNGEKFITDAFYEREFKILIGDMDPEETVDFLEAQQIYNPAILDKLKPHRAFEYLYAIRASWKSTKAYAERVLDEAPDNPDARMCLLDFEQDDAKAAAEYQDIISKHPEHPGALNGLGYRLHYDHPKEAIQYLKKANQLDPTRGLFSLGLAYERLGDVKTAWLYYRKQQTVANGPLIQLHVDQIESGKPVYKPIQQTRSPIPPPQEKEQDIGKGPHETTSETFVEETPWLPELLPLESQSPENQPTDEERRRTAHAKAAWTEFQRQQEAAQRELNEFLQWAETILCEENPIDTNNFLTKELSAHLKGGNAMFEPERTIRAFEMIERYGPKAGLKRLKEKDAELAEQVEHLIEKNDHLVVTTHKIENE